MAKIDSLLSGVGEFGDVAVAIIESARHDEVSESVLNEFVFLLEKQLPSNKAGKYLRGLFCAWLNQSFTETGYIYSSGNDGQIHRFYFDAGGERDMILDLLKY